MHINTITKPKTDANGDTVTDLLGNTEMVSLTEEEKTAKVQIANELFEKAKNGENFDEMITKYSDFTNKDSYPNGYYVSTLEMEALTQAGMPTQLMLDTYNAEDGTFVLVNDETRGCFIAQKLPCENKAYQSSHKDAMQLANLVNQLLQSKYDKMLDTMWDRIKVNETMLLEISIIDVKRGLNIGKSNVQ